MNPLPSHLTIILPGRGYGAEGPVLHLPRLALEKAGAQAAVVTAGSGGAGRGL
jgi:hypothetical protein